MGDISRHFSRWEFACRCGCGQDVVDVLLVGMLEDIRYHYGDRSVNLSSGNRCPQHNKDEDGGEFSQHLLGKAADFKVEGISPSQVQDYFDKRHPRRYGMGRYETFTHADSRDVYARW